VQIEREAERTDRPAMEMLFELLDEFRTTDQRTKGEAARPTHPATETEQPLTAD
jgi:hypothetical protein